MIVDDRERAKQAFTRFAIEALDALAQPLDRFDQVVALAGQRGGLALDLAQFLLRAPGAPGGPAGAPAAPARRPARAGRGGGGGARRRLCFRLTPPGPRARLRA